MVRRPPRSKRTDTLFPSRRSAELKLLLVDSRRIAPGAMVDGTEIATFAPPYIHDNFEAVAATREGGDTNVWIASDDNQSILQRSLLLKFRMIEPAQPGGTPPRGIKPKRGATLQHSAWGGALEETFSDSASEEG